MAAPSSLDTLHQVINDCNPFESHFIVKSHQVWDEDFPDVPSLHAYASQEILSTLDKINNGQLLSKTASLVILAPKGVGKTHVLSRIRQQVKQKGNSIFIYMCEYGNLSLIKCQFLHGLASSLKRKGSQGVMQWQEFATCLINKALQREYPPQALIERFSRPLSNKTQLINQLNERVLAAYPEIDNPYIIKAILWTLSSPHVAFAVNWLAGGELSEAQAKRMDLPDSTEEDKELLAFNNTRQILDLISSYTTPIICFDELDGVEIADEEDEILGGFTRAQVVASLVKDIYNNLQRGVLITAAYRKTWREEFSQLYSFTAAKDRIAHQEIELRLLKSDDAIALISGWLQNFYSQHNVVPPTPVYPFDENELRSIGDGAAIRDILQWCAKNFSKPVPLLEALEKMYQQIEADLEDFSDEGQKNQQIGDALAFAIQHLKGQTIERVKIKRINKKITPRTQHRGYINFKIEGEEDGKKVSIGVCVLENSNGNTVGAAIGYLTKYDVFKLTRGCLIRSKDINSGWKVANQNLNQLLKEQGGEWISPKNEEVKPLLILHQMYKDLDTERFSDEIFQQFITEKHPLDKNTLLREILSDPSGQAPENVVDVDAGLDALFADDESTTEVTDDDLSELLPAA